MPVSAAIDRGDRCVSCPRRFSVTVQVTTLLDLLIVDLPPAEEVGSDALRRSLAGLGSGLDR